MTAYPDLPDSSLADLANIRLYGERNGSPKSATATPVSQILSLITAAAQGYGRYETTELRVADTTRPAGYLAYVYENNGSPTDSENGYWQATGNPASAWVRASWISNDLIAAVQPSVNLAQAWAEGTLPGGAGTKSAKEWSTSASGFATAASGSADTAAAAAAALTPFNTAPAGSAALSRVSKVELYTWYGVRRINWPAYMGFRDFARGSGGNADRFRSRIASFDAAGAFVANILMENSSGQAFLGVSGVTKQQPILLYPVSGALTAGSDNVAIPISVPVANHIVNFGAGEAFAQTSYAGNDITYAVGGLSYLRWQKSGADDNHVNGLISSNVTVNYLASAASHFVTTPNEASTTTVKGLLNATRITIYPQYDLGANLVCLRENGMRSSDRFFRAQIATFDGTSTYTLLCATNSNNALNLTGVSGLKTYLLYAIAGNALGIAAGTVIGEIEEVIPPTGGIGTYATSIAYADGALITSRIQMSAATKSAINALIETALAAEAERDDEVFIQAVRSVQLRSLFQRIKVEGGDPGSQYGLSFIECYRYGSFDRIRLTFRDFTQGIDVAQRTFQSATGTQLTASALPTTMVIQQGTLSNYYGAQIWVEWDRDYAMSLVTGLFSTGTTYSTYSAAGLRPENVVSNEQMDDFIDEDGGRPRRVIRVGASGWDFTTVRAANDSLHRSDIGTVTYSSMPITDAVAYSNQVMIEVMDDDWRENLNGMVPAPYVIIRGRGAGNTVFSTDDATKRVLEATQSVRLEYLTIKQEKDQYLGHIDNANGMSKPATTGRAIQRWIIRQATKAVEFIARPTQSEWGLGVGLSSGQRIFMYDPIFDRQGSATNAFLGIHNSPNSVLPGIVKLVRPRATNNAGGGAEVGLLCSFPQRTHNQLIIEDADGSFNLVSAAADTLATNNAGILPRARDMICWDFFIVGNDNVTVSIVEPRCRVLSMAAGTAALSGTGATAIMGEYDSVTGQGDQLTLDGSVRSLAARLGNCTSVAKPISNGSQTWPGNADYSAMSESAILASINAVLTSTPITPVRIDTQIAA